MNVEKLESLPPPPGVINSLRAGFNAVSSHVRLIILPLALDLILWLGPRLSVGTLYRSLATDWLNLIKMGGFSAQDIEKINESTTNMVDLLGRANWFSWLRTIPIGIPSLILGNLPEKLPLRTPLGLQAVLQMPSVLALVGSMVLMTLIGWVGGGLYFRWVSGITLAEKEAGISSLQAVVQTINLSVIWIIAFLIFFMPAGFFVYLLSLISPTFAILVFTFLSFWFIVPLFFTPHGIFVLKQNALLSIRSSLRLARFTLPSSSMFVLSVFILSQGLNYLWTVAPNDSWMTLVGIFGHAFIATALLSASFIYYRDMTAWLQTVSTRIQQMKIPAQRV